MFNLYQNKLQSKIKSDIHNDKQISWVYLGKVGFSFVFHEDRHVRANRTGKVSRRWSQISLDLYQ